jgi:hypothetical protein
MLFCGFGNGREDKNIDYEEEFNKQQMQECKRRAMNLFSIDLSDLVKNNKTICIV